MTIRATRATFLNTPKSVMNTSEAVIRGGDPRRRATYLITPKPVINTAKAMIRGGQRV